MEDDNKEKEKISKTDSGNPEWVKQIDNESKLALGFGQGFKKNIWELRASLVTPSDFSQYKDYIAESSTDFGGTVRMLEEKINLIESEMTTLSQTQDSEQTNNRFLEIKKEIADIKGSVIPRLEESIKALDSVNQFITEQSGFLVNLVSAEGKLTAIQGEINSLMARVTAIENAKEKNWQRVTTIITLLIAISALLVSILK